MKRKLPIPITHHELRNLLETGRLTDAKHTKLLAILVAMCAEARTWEAVFSVSDIIDIRCDQISPFVKRDQPTRDDIHADLRELERCRFIIFKTASQVYLTEGGIELVEELLPPHPTLPPSGLTAADFEGYAQERAYRPMAAIVGYCRRLGEWPQQITIQDLLRDAYNLPISLDNAPFTMNFSGQPHGDVILRAISEIGFLLAHGILISGDHPDTLQIADRLVRSAYGAAEKRTERRA
ncbi:hypothetical protein KBD34_00285 [Patescibacteria group bacterium]|nr:hypothetical protein [Patescibacteria group bacterium]